MQWRQYRYVFTDYRLLIVIYGDTSTAPYLALRILEQLVDNEGAEFSLAVPGFYYFIRHSLTIALLV